LYSFCRNEGDSEGPECWRELRGVLARYSGSAEAPQANRTPDARPV